MQHLFSLFSPTFQQSQVPAVGGLDPNVRYLCRYFSSHPLPSNPKTRANRHDMTLIICTSHPADKLKTINAIPVIMVHRHCRGQFTGLVASPSLSHSAINVRVASICSLSHLNRLVSLYFKVLNPFSNIGLSMHKFFFPGGNDMSLQSVLMCAVLVGNM